MNRAPTPADSVGAQFIAPRFIAPAPVFLALMSGRGVRSVLALMVFAATFAILYDRAARVGYNTDEGQAIWPSQYFQFVFLDGKVGDPPWGPNYWTLTQTPVYRYIIGAGTWLGGQRFQDLDLDFRRDEVSGADRAKYFDPATYRDERK